jgi:hypothetical protein
MAVAVGVAVGAIVAVGVGVKPASAILTGQIQRAASNRINAAAPLTHILKLCRGMLDLLLE